MFLGLVDQLVSSLTNVMVVVFASRRLDLDEVGVVGLALLLFTTANGISRACTSDVLVARHSASGPAVFAWAAQRALGFASLAGGFAGSLLAGSALLLPSSPRDALLALSLGLPVVLIQDVCRVSLVITQRSGFALASDLVWLVVTLALLANRWLPPTTAANTVGAWVLGGAAGAGVGLIGLAALPLPHRGLGFVRSRSHLAWRFSAEYALVSASSVLGSLVVLGVAGLRGAGVFRLAQTIMGPFTTLIQGIVLVATPRLARIGDPWRVIRRAVQLAAVVLAVAIAWLLVVVTAPIGLGVSLLGQNWRTSRTTTILVICSNLPLVTTFAAAAATRSFADAKATLRARALIVPAQLAAMAAGGSVAGINGVVVGGGVINVLAVPIWWISAFRSAQRRSDAVSGSSRSASPPGALARRQPAPPPSLDVNPPQ